MADPSAPDLIIRGGTLVDGTGAPSFVGDVAVSGSKISAVGPSLPFKAPREIDARGLLVTPGWVDCHTHYDGQVSWDPYLQPSSGGGVTTVIFGNCGVGVAPCQQERRDDLLNLVEAIEDIPKAVVQRSMAWEWESFEEYMDALSAKKLACDVGAMIGHGPLRNWVLGPNLNVSDRPGGKENNPVRKEDIEAMAAVVRDAVAAGALGFSTSRAIYHRDLKGVLMPGTLASRDEMLALVRALGDAGGGTFSANLDFKTYDDHVAGKIPLDQRKVEEHFEHEWSWLSQIAEESHGKIHMTFEAAEFSPERHVRAMDLMKRYEDTGFRIRTQCFARPQGFLQSIHSRMNLLQTSKTFRKMQRSFFERVENLKQADYQVQTAAFIEELRQPTTRQTILKEGRTTLKECSIAFKENKNHALKGLVSTMLPWRGVFHWSSGYEPDPASLSVHALAKREERHPFEVYYDILVPPTGADFGVAWKALAVYGTADGWNDHEKARETLELPITIFGGGDGGAHCGIFQDAQSPSHTLTHWARDRARGPRLPIEMVVSKQTKEVADLFHLTDRGVLLPGMKADINVIDFEKLKMEQPFLDNELFVGTSAWIQKVSGYRHTFVSGQETFTDGVPTGALPGRFVRNPKRDAGAWQGAAHRFAWRSTAKGQDDAADFTAQALKGAEGGGMSSIARIARSLEKDEDKDTPSAPAQSKL